jgi:hypothetical protein
MIALGIVAYLLIGLTLARFTAVYFNEKNKLVGSELGWSDNFFTVLLVICLPILWPLTPLLLVGKGFAFAGSKADGLITYAAKELANPKENV